MPPRDRNPPTSLLYLKRYRHTVPRLLSTLLFAATICVHPVHSAHTAPSGREDYIFSEIDHSRGLSHSSVICIYKDDSELMWFGTYDGLNCFDGNRMEIFRTDLSQSHSQTLDNNVIYGIDKADGDNLWISTRMSVTLFSRGDRTVVANYGVSPEASLHSNSRGDTWLVDCDSLSCYNTRHRRFEGLEKLGLHTSDPVSRAFVTRDGELWLFPDSDAGDLYKISVGGFDRESGPAVPAVTKLRFHPKPVESIFHDDDMSFCFIDADKNLYIYDVWRQTKVFIRNIAPLQERYGHIVGVAPFYEDFVIAFRTNGLVRLNADAAYDDEIIDRNLRIFCLRKDTEQGALWIGVDGRGAMMYAKRHTVATNLMMQRLSPNFTRQVRSIMTDSRGGLWIGTKGDGLIHVRDYAEGMNPDNTVVYSAESRQSARNYVRENTEFQVFALEQSRYMDGFWIGSGPQGIWYRMTDDAGLHRLDLPSGPQVEEVHAFHEADDTTLYVAAARGGLHRLTLDRTGGRPRVTARSRYRFFHRRQELSTFFSMISEGDSVLWLGSREQGLVRFSTATSSYDVYSLRELLGRPVDDVLCLARTSDGALLAGTTAGMVSLRFDGRKVVEARYIGREDGLLNDMIHGIREDADGFLWISTNKGLIKYNPATVSSHTYYYSGGVQVGEFCDDAYYKCPYTGRLFFGGIDGLLYIDSGGAVDREYYPDILLRGMSFGRNPVDLSDFYVGGELRFEYTDEEIALRFAVPDYISGSGIEYSWMLEGCGKEWSRFAPSSEVFYRGLPVGSYTFRIRYRKDIFDTDFKTLAIPVRVLPLWYQTTAARMTFAAIAAALLFAAAMRIRRAGHRRRLMSRLRQCEHDDMAAPQSVPDIRDRESVAGLTVAYRLCETLRSGNLSAEKHAKTVDRLREIVVSLLWPYGLYGRSTNRKIPPPLPSDLHFGIAGDMAVKEIADEAIALMAGRGIDLSGVETDIPRDLSFPLYKNAFRMLFVYASLFAAGGRRFRVSASAADSKLTLSFASKSSVVRHLRDSLADASAPLPIAAGRDADTVFEIRVLHDLVVQAMKQLAPDIVCDEERSVLSLTFAAADCPEREDERRVVLMLEDRDEMYWFVSELLSAGYAVRRVRSIRSALEFMEHTPPAAFLVDMNMYADAGDAFMELVDRSRAAAAHTVFIPLLSWRIPYSVRRDMVLHADAYAVLPYDAAYLREIVHKAVYGRIAKSESVLIDGLSADLADLFVCTTGEQVDFVRRMVAVIEENIESENFGPSFIADKLAMSPRRFYRRFKEVSSFPPAMFIKNYRLEKAATLLAETDMPIREVMDRIGITSRSYFYREFAAKYATTPSDYRHAHGGAAASPQSEEPDPE